MAQGKTQTVTVNLNNKKNPLVTVTKTVELVVIDGNLVPHPNEVNPGVNSIYQ